MLLLFLYFIFECHAKPNKTPSNLANSKVKTVFFKNSEQVFSYLIHTRVTNTMFVYIISIIVTFLLLLALAQSSNNPNILDETPHCCNFTFRHRRAEDGC